ncbi:energy-coupling factor ABC transporter ATP-binding protein [Streptococcus hyointestinalis]|uniref:energy-coupling factor ABC transporter ATP-binding protein n=1 Tax=Streptococcus hyointestinalis TaxID=1337 RepID=UPI0013E0A2FF|nr:ABC transporter ATP-binding protein [Streptococcus hyointestinalis]
MYQLDNISCAYDERLIFENVNLTIKKGDYVVVLGENGQGKSTFLDLLMGFKAAESGKLLFEGDELKQILKHRKSKQAYYQGLGILFQDVDIQLFNQTVYDEIAFSLYQANRSEEEIKERVLDLADVFGIHDLLGRIPYQLSGGEKKKVAKEATEQLKAILRHLNSIGKTIILSTHHYHYLADENTKVCLVKDGKITLYNKDTTTKDQDLKDLFNQF